MFLRMKNKTKKEMSSFWCNQRQRFKVKLPHNTGCCQCSHTSSVVSLAMSQWSSCLHSLWPPWQSSSKHNFSLPRFSDSTTYAGTVHRERQGIQQVGHRHRAALQIPTWKWLSLPQQCSGGWRLLVFSRAPQNGSILAVCVCLCGAGEQLFPHSCQLLRSGLWWSTHIKVSYFCAFFS